MARIQFGLCLVIVSSVLTYLLWTPDAGSPLPAQRCRRPITKATFAWPGPRCICLRPDCPLCRKLQVTTVEAARITAPVVTVTGTVVASLRPGNGKGNDYWQFNSPELLTAFTDWQKATADIAFAETQLAQIKQLADTKVDAQQKLVERMKKLVAAGTDTEKDLAAAQADLIQSPDPGTQRRPRGGDGGAAGQADARPRWRGNSNRAGLEPDLLRSMTSGRRYRHGRRARRV